MDVVILSATDKEISQIKQELSGFCSDLTGSLQLSFHITGVGLLSSCFSIAALLFKKKPDLIIQAGIAGSFNTSIPLGTVVAVKEEILADTGVEETGHFKDLFDLQLEDPNRLPFTDKRLSNPYLERLNYLHLPAVTAISINEITTRPVRIDQLKTKYRPVIESMEGASMHYCCLSTATPFIQLRAISNYIGERDKSKWNFKDALGNLTNCVLQYIEHLH